MLTVARKRWKLFVGMGVVEALGSVLGFYGGSKLPGAYIWVVQVSEVVVHTAFHAAAGRVFVYSKFAS